MSTSLSTFGRVDEDNNVFTIEAGTERKVGQYPGVTPAEALAYFERKFIDLEAQVRLLEQRVKGKADAQSLKKAITKLNEDLKEPAAVGDVAALRERVTAVQGKVLELVAEKLEQNKELIEAEVAKRAGIAEKAEMIAAQDVSKIHWKNTSLEMNALFEQWQETQKNGPKLSKSDADPIWKRFSTARTKFESAKRAYFATLDSANKAAKAAKAQIVADAEALVAKGSDAINDYRKLLDSWKTSGRSQSKVDDELWARFKAAGDAIYAAKSEVVAQENTEQSANLALKLELLVEAEKLDPAKDLAGAKKQLQAIQARWEKAGRVPREKLREVEDRLKAVETKVRKLEEEQWRKSDPVVMDRTNSVLEQLDASIQKLEAQVTEAKKSKDAKKLKDAEDALAARIQWREIVKNSL
ncbi:MAG: hypothetical protein RLZ28_49 [Actinomycetota bacterium]